MRRGAALLTVLWLVVALAGAAGAALAAVRLGASTSRNRVLLTRADWAREACAEILLGRYAEQRKVGAVSRTDLGRGTWCRLEIEDAGNRLNLAHATPEMIRLLLRDDSLSDALLDWTDLDDEPRPSGAEAEWYRSRSRRPPGNRPLAATAELGYVRGFDSSRVRALERLVTTRGGPTVDINVAPPEVLAVLPGMSREALADILVQRRRRIASADELLARLGRSGREGLVARYQEFTAVAGFGATRYVVLAEGGVEGTPVTSRGWLTLVPADGRLAVVRREVE